MSIRLTSSAAVVLLAATSLFARQAPPIRQVALTRDTVLDGVPCRRTGGFPYWRKAELHPAGTLRACELSEQHVLTGHELPAGSWVYLDAQGTLEYTWLRRDTLLQGLPCRGTGHGGWQTTFHDTGALRTCWLARDAIIEGVPCSRATFVGELRGGASTVFDRDGRLLACRAATDFSHGEARFRRGDRVEPGRIRH
jgi:hypothetical protein